MNDWRVIDSGFFGSSETILICKLSFWGALSQFNPGSTPFSFCSPFQSWSVIDTEPGLLFASPLSFWGACDEESTQLHTHHVRIVFHVQITLPFSTPFPLSFQHNCSLLGHEHPPHPPIYFTFSTIFSLYDEVTEKYFKADSLNPGEKSFTLSITSPHSWIEFGRYTDFSEILDPIFAMSKSCLSCRLIPYNSSSQPDSLNWNSGCNTMVISPASVNDHPFVVKISFVFFSKSSISKYILSSSSKSI